MELRGQTETVAVMRRSLPPGGLSEEDYVFRRLDPLHREEDGNSYTADCFGRTAGLAAAMRAERGHEDERDWDEPMINVFHKADDEIRHFWGGELVYAPEEPDQHHRALDAIDPFWGLLDLLPEGRADSFLGSPILEPQAET